MYNYDIERDEEPDWDALDQKADEDYDRHIDAIAHFPDEIFRSVMYLPTVLALAEGEKLLKQQAANREIARSIWGDTLSS